MKNNLKCKLTISELNTKLVTLFLKIPDILYYALKRDCGSWFR